MFTQSLVACSGEGQERGVGLLLKGVYPDVGICKVEGSLCL